MLIKEESTCWSVLGLFQADTELCQCSYRLPGFPKANERAPGYVSGTYQGSRSRLFTCKSVLSKLLLESVASWLWACCRFCSAVNPAEMGSDGREHRLEGTTGRGFGCSFFPSLPQSNFLFVRAFMFPFFLLLFMIRSWAIALEQRREHASKVVSQVLIKQDWERECGAVCLEYSLNLFSTVELVSCTGSTVRSLSWNPKCVSKHRFGGSR